MKKIVIIIAAIALLGGGLVIFAGSNKEKETEQSATTQNTAGTNSSSQTQSNGKTFSPVSTSDVSFVATVTSESQDGTTTGSLEYDQKSGNMRFSTTVEGQKSELVYTSDAYYICNDGTCYKTSLGQGNTAGFERENYEFSQSEIDRFKNLATNQGTQSCPSGTCDVWRIAENNSNETLIYIDTKSNYISQVKNTADGSKNTIVYEYKDVTVTPPTNAQELPALQGIGN